MARKRVLSAMSAAIAFLPIVLSPAPVLAGPESLLLPVGHATVEVLHTPAASKHGHEVSMPSRPADPDGLKAAKARAESGASREVKANSLKAEAVVAAGAPCSSVTQTVSPASPQPPGTTVTFTATATGCPNPTYQFWLLPPGGGWSVTQAYSSSNTWNWSTSGVATGTYTLDVYARDASSTAAYDAHISPNPTYVLNAAAARTCTSVTESANPVSPQAAGATVKFTATATGCPNPLYQFWLQAPGGGWSVAQAYSSNNTWNWSTSGLGAGTYALDLYARDATSTAAYDAHLSPNPTYVLNAASTTCTSVTEAATPASPQSPGATVKFTASATGCPNPTFQFWLQAPGGGWSVTQAYSSNNIWSWSTSGLATGTYTIDVYARDASSTATFDAHISPNPTYELSAGPACASVTETAIPASPQSPGTTVNFTATATGCPNPTYSSGFRRRAAAGRWSRP